MAAGVAAAWRLRAHPPQSLGPGVVLSSLICPSIFSLGYSRFLTVPRLWGFVQQPGKGGRPAGPPSLNHSLIWSLEAFLLFPGRSQAPADRWSGLGDQAGAPAPLLLMRLLSTSGIGTCGTQMCPPLSAASSVPVSSPCSTPRGPRAPGTCCGCWTPRRTGAGPCGLGGLAGVYPGSSCSRAWIGVPRWPPAGTCSSARPCTRRGMCWRPGRTSACAH